VGADDDGELPELSPASVNKDLRALKVCMRKAEKWGQVDRAPSFELLREPERDPFFIDDAAFRALYDACEKMTRPAGRHFPAVDWWRALLCFAYMTGWRIGEILELRRADVDFETGIATVDAASTKGRRTARVELHPIVIDHLKVIMGFGPLVFEWPYHERTLWSDFAALKESAGLDFPGAFHRLRFGFCNANVDALPADLLQRLMRHQAASTTRRYINAAERMKRAGTAAKLHVPDVLRKSTAV
jgi:integrase